LPGFSILSSFFWSIQIRLRLLRRRRHPNNGSQVSHTCAETVGKVGNPSLCTSGPRALRGLRTRCTEKTRENVPAGRDECLNSVLSSGKTRDSVNKTACHADVIAFVVASLNYSSKANCSKVDSSTHLEYRAGIHGRDARIFHRVGARWEGSCKGCCRSGTNGRSPDMPHCSTPCSANKSIFNVADSGKGACSG